MSKSETTLTEAEKAMQWERMSGERLSDADRRRLQNGEKFVPPHLRPETTDKTIDETIDGQAAYAILCAFRQRAGLTHYAHRSNLLSDISRMKAALKELGLTEVVRQRLAEKWGMQP